MSKVTELFQVQQYREECQEQLKRLRGMLRAEETTDNGFSFIEIGSPYTSHVRFPGHNKKLIMKLVALAEALLVEEIEAADRMLQAANTKLEELFGEEELNK